MSGFAREHTGNRARGRQRQKFMDRVKKLVRTTEGEDVSIQTIFSAAHDREKWRFMVAKACVRQGT